MKWRDWIEEWGMTSLKINVGFLNMEWEPHDSDRKAAWEMYVELLTRVTTQSLPDEDGDEQTALTSVYNIFGITRDILRKNEGSNEFAKIAIVVLNQVIRPFTAKWHRKSLSGAFNNSAENKAFRQELHELQKKICLYTGMLAQMAGVENLTKIEFVE